MHEKSHNVLIKGLSGRLIIQLTYKFRVILIAFCWVFHVFRSDRWLIYVVWVIHYLIINIKRRFLQGGGDCTAGHNFSRDHKNKSAYKSTDSGQRKCTKSNKSLELPSFIWFGKASSTSESHYISMYFAFRYHTTSLLLSLSLSLSSLLSLHWYHPSKKKQYSFISRADNDAWAWWKALFRCCHYKAIFFHWPHVKEIQRQGPKCNTLISLKLFIGICGALAAGLSPFQLPDLFNLVGNEKCAAQLELWSEKAFTPFTLSFSPSPIISHTCSSCSAQCECVCWRVGTACSKLTPTCDCKRLKTSRMSH